VVFPTSEGRFFDFESNDMLGCCSHLFEQGKVQFYCVDSIDSQTFYNKSSSHSDRGWRQKEYENCIIDEVVPFIRHNNSYSGGMITTGCSFGAFHALNFLLRHPDVFDTCICLSGIYSLKWIIGEYNDQGCFFQDPMAYIPGLSDEWFLSRLRGSKIIIAVGQGRWENEALQDSHQVADILRSKGIPVWLDKWGSDVDHDWPWWRKQLPHFLGNVGL